MALACCICEPARSPKRASETYWSDAMKNRYKASSTPEMPISAMADQRR
ncbi:Uncharacterised protein [Bordetella pertussis]|nr:Uncharacterised protein [Bordetella pertussis]